MLITRKLGQGSLVLSTDSYLFSNEALRREARPALLAWTLGPNRLIVVDETHLDVADRPGVATLAWRYRLEWLAFTLLLLSGLFIWRNVFSLVPPLADRFTVAERAHGAPQVVDLGPQSP